MILADKFWMDEGEEDECWDGQRMVRSGIKMGGDEGLNKKNAGFLFRGEKKDFRSITEKETEKNNFVTLKWLEIAWGELPWHLHGHTEGLAD